eukprot:XP_008664993.2 uncharacterized protein LOC103643607 isoform X2 [Zea mays]
MPCAPISKLGCSLLLVPNISVLWNFDALACRLGPSPGHGHSSEIYGPGDGVGGCHLSCCSYGGHRGKYHACHNHSSEWARHNISPEPGPIRSYWITKRTSSDHVSHCAKGSDRQIRPAGGYRKNYSANQGSGSQNRPYHDDRYLPTKFLDDRFPEIDAAKHQSYLCDFQSSSKHIPVHPSHGQSCQRDEVAKAHPKRPVNRFRPIHHKQLERCPNEDFHDCFDSSQKFRNAYNDKVVKRKFIKQDFLGNTYNGACVGKYDRNSCRKRNADHFGGEKTRKNDANKDRSKRLRCPLEQDQRQQVECNEMRNDSREGNVEMTRLVCQDGAKRNFNQKKNATAPASSDSTKCDGKNILSPKCSKTIASSHTPNLSEGSDDMDPKSDNYVDGCTERGILQHIPVTHTERNIQLKISDNFTQSEAFRRDCLILWRERQLRKDSAAKADNIVKTDQQQTAQRSKMSTGRRVGSGGSAASSCSKSDNKDDSAPECSDQFSGATSSDKLQKFGEGRANKKLEQTIKFPSNSKCNKRPQDATAEKVLKCSLKLLSEADPLEIAQPKGKEKLVDRRQVSTEHQDAKTHSSLNGCSDTCKVDQAAISHCHNSAHQNIFQQEKNSAVSDARREEKPGVKCEKKAAGHGAKLAEQSTGLYSDPISLDKETVVSCSKHGTSKVNALKVPDHEIESTSLDGSMLPRGTVVDMCLRKSINRSSESYCIDFKDCLDGNDCRDSQQETTHDNVLRKKQECSLLPETKDELNGKARKEDCEPQARRVEIESNQRITTEDCASDTILSGSAKQDDRIRCSSIPDLNCLPSMSSDEDFMAPPEEPVCQVSVDSFKPQSISKSLSASLTGHTPKRELFKQVEGKQCDRAEETNQIAREVCKDGTSEAATQLQISESNTGPPQLRTAEESSTPMNALKSALYEFVKGCVRPLWEDGLLSREVHKFVVKKAVDKVLDVWAHSTEINVPRILSDEAEGIRTLVKDYLKIYVGSEALRKSIPTSS